MPSASGVITNRGRQVLWLDGNDQTITGIQFWVNPVSGPKIAKRLGYVQAAIEVPSLGTTLEVAGRSVWYNGVQIPVPSTVISVDVQFALVFWSEISSGNWFLRY